MLNNIYFYDVNHKNKLYRVVILNYTQHKI